MLAEPKPFISDSAPADMLRSGQTPGTDSLPPQKSASASGSDSDSDSDSGKKEDTPQQPSGGENVKSTGQKLPAKLPRGADPTLLGAYTGKEGQDEFVCDDGKTKISFEKVRSVYL
jgi:hypothetical protein